MPNAHRLTILAELRRKAHVTLEQMAQACGLVSRKGRESASAWEQGQSVPHARTRTKFIDYLGDTLRLQSEPALFHQVWGVLVDEWNWEPVGEAEWQQHFGHAGVLASAVGASLPAPELLNAKALLAHLPTTGGALSPAEPLPPGSRMPFSRNPLFVGRVDDLRVIATALKGAQTAAIGSVEIAAASGLGGIGKTQLAIEFVHRYGRYFAGGVFWLSFADANAVPSEIAACGAAGHLALHPNFEALPLDQQTKLVLEAWASPLPRLLVFDNCEDQALLNRWRPRVGGCRILLTSRRSQWDAAIGVQILLLGVLSRRESVALLRKHCPDLLPNHLDLIAIAAELGDLPLALHLAGHYLARYRREVSPAAYTRQLHSPQLLEHPSLQASGISPTGHEQHVARTFAISYDRLDPAVPTDQRALALLVRAAHFSAGERIPQGLLFATLTEEALKAWADPTTQPEHFSQYIDALARLVELGLLEPSSAHGDTALRMHRLVAAFVRQILPDATAQAAVEQTLYEIMRRLNAEGKQVRLLALQPHLRAVADVALTRGDARAATFSYELSQHLFDIEDYSGAQHYNQHSLDIRTTIFGPADPAIAENLHHMGWMLHMQWRYAESRSYHERALLICQLALGEEHSVTAESYNYLGAVLHAQDQYGSALPVYKRALAIREQVLGTNHPDTAQTLNNLGLLLHISGNYAEALRFHRRALTIREQAFDANHPKLAFTLNNLGYLLRSMARYTEALPYLKRALMIREQLFGPTNSYVAVTLNHLGRLLHSTGDYPASRVFLERTLAIYEQVFGANQVDAAHSLGNFGMLLYDEGDLGAAQPYLERALTIHRQMLGENNRHVARGLNHMGMLLHRQRKHSYAYQCYQQALAIRDRVLGPQHPDTGNSLGNIGMLLLDLGDMATAQKCLERALLIHERAFEHTHPYTARSLDRIGMLLIAQGQIEKGRQYVERALAIYQQVLGDNHPFALACRTRLL